VSKRNKIKKIIALVIMPLILLYLINSISNWHYHKLSTGQVICHSHPYHTESDGNIPFQSHPHTDAEYLILTLLSNPLVIAFMVLLVLSLNLPRIPEIRTLYIQPKYCKEVLFIPNGRAPPVFSNL